jgi:hypothetical protein
VYAGHTPQDILGILKRKLLVKDLDLNEIAFRHSRINNLIVEWFNEGVQKDEIIRRLGISEMLAYFSSQAKDVDMRAAFSVLEYNPVRNTIEMSIIYGENTDITRRFVSEDNGFPISEKAIELYGHYFWNKRFTKNQWFTFLRHHDVFGYAGSLTDSEFGRIFKEKLNRKSFEKTEYDLIARKTFEHLTKALDDEVPDPKKCSEWYRVFESSRAKSNVPAMLGDIKEGATDGYSIGFTDLSNVGVKRLEDFSEAPKEEPKS